MNKKHKMMGTESITKLLMQFSIPAVIGMVVNALYNIVDRIYIGNIKSVGYYAIGGVGLIFPVIIFAFAFSMLVGLGTGTNMSLNLGRKNKCEAEKFLGNGIGYGLIISVVLMALVLGNMDWLIRILGGSENTTIFAKEYLSMIALGFPAAILGYVANVGIRSDGNPRMAMATLLIGAIINIILDPIFIFYFGLGIKGAGIATIISQYASAIWTMYYFNSSLSGLKLYAKYLVPKFERIKRITALGSAPFALQIGASIVNYTYNSTLNIYGGDKYISAMAIIQGIVIFLSMPIFGINQGVQPILGYNYGAKLFDRVKEAYWKAVIVASSICMVAFITTQLLSKYYVFIFTKDIIDITTTGLKINTIMFPIIGFQIISSVYFQAVGKPKLSLFITLSRQIIILIPCIKIMGKLFGVTGIWFSAPIADFLSTSLTYYLIRGEMKSLKKLTALMERDQQTEELN